MFIHVIGTEVVWSGEEYEEPTDGSILFEVDDFPGPPDDGEELHWDGTRWWTESDGREGERALSALFAVSNLTASIPDADALKMRGFIPAFDASRNYSEGELAVRNGVVCRRTSIGWREIG